MMGLTDLGVKYSINETFLISNNKRKPMVENLTCQLASTDVNFNILTTILTILGSLIIAVFVVHYTNFVNRRNECDVLINWFNVEANILEQNLLGLKSKINLALTQLEQDPNTIQWQILVFPTFTLVSFNELISKGCWKFYPIEEIQKCANIKDCVETLSGLKARYDQLTYYTAYSINASTPKIVKDYIKLRKENYNSFIEVIDITSERIKQYKVPKTLSFFQFTRFFFKRNFSFK